MFGRKTWSFYQSAEVEVDVVASGGVDVLVPAPEGDEGAALTPSLHRALEVLRTLPVAESKEKWTLICALSPCALSPPLSSQMKFSEFPSYCEREIKLVTDFRLHFIFGKKQNFKEKITFHRKFVLDLWDRPPGHTRFLSVHTDRRRRCPCPPPRGTGGSWRWPCQGGSPVRGAALEIFSSFLCCCSGSSEMEFECVGEWRVHLFICSCIFELCDVLQLKLNSFIHNRFFC